MVSFSEELVNFMFALFLCAWAGVGFYTLYLLIVIYHSTGCGI
jgi:hypothetical protein